jgi:hypothetical protein
VSDDIQSADFMFSSIGYYKSGEATA